MHKKVLFVLNGFFLIRGGFANFIHVDDSLNPGEVKQNQVFFNRKERFIKFDTKDNELDIELGISIPFVKVPLLTGRELLDHEQAGEISINGPGVVIAGMLMLTSFVLIPFLFTTQSLPEDSFGFQRSADNGHNGLWTLVKSLDETLKSTGIDSSSCVKKSFCWMAKASGSGETGSFHKFFNYLLNTWWKPGESDFDFCNDRRSQCSLTAHHLTSFMEIIKGSQRH